MNQRHGKVVHLSSVHKATDTRIFVKECRSLAAAGYDVTLIANADRDDVVDGVKIRALKGLGGSRLRRMTKTTIEMLRAAWEVNGDIYHFHDPELILVGIALKLSGKRVLYDVHENVSKQIRSKEWIPKALRFFVAGVYRGVERTAVVMLDGVVAATPGISQQFPANKTVVVQNFALIEEFASIDTANYNGRPNSIAYIGNITRVRGIEEMVRAMERVSNEATMIVGGVFDTQELLESVEQCPGFQRVQYLGWLSREHAVKVLSNVRMGLVVLHPEPNYLDSYPVKLFEYMAAGLPVIASNFPFWEQFVIETRSGLMVDPKNPDAIAAAIDWILTNSNEAYEMGQRGRSIVQTHYSWELEAKKLLSFYQELLAVPKALPLGRKSVE